MLMHSYFSDVSQCVTCVILAFSRLASVCWTGEKHEAKFTGLTARVFLHELDHMNGIVYTTRVKPLALKSGMKKVEKTYRKYFGKNMANLIKHGDQKTNP